MAIKNYTIYQPADASVHNIEELIKHALKAIVNKAGDNPIELNRFDLEHPSGDKGLYGIAYGLVSPDLLALR